MMQPDPTNDPDTFTCQPSEKIQLITTVNKAPLLALFPQNPIGGMWNSAVQDMIHLTDTRIFVCPTTNGSSLFFNMSCDEQIAPGDPDPTAHYRITVSSLTNTADGVFVSNVNVPQGLGPVPRTFTFNVSSPKGGRKLTNKAVSLALCLGALASTAFCQSSDQTMTNLVKLYEAQDTKSRLETFSSPQIWLDTLALQGTPPSGTAASVASIKDAIAPAIAQSRTDQQTTAPAGMVGTTSPASKGSVPWLLSFAEEYGGLTQSVSGSVTTVHGNVANIIKAVSTKEYQKSFDVGANNPFINSVSKASFSIGLNTGTTGSSTSTVIQPSTFSSAAAHIDLFNQRDPRNTHWDEDWKGLDAQQGKDIEDEVDRELVTLKKTGAYPGWLERTQRTLAGLADSDEGQADRDVTISTALKGILEDFTKTFGSPGILQSKILKVKLDAYSKQKQTITDKINKSRVFSFEYTFTNQSSVQLPKSTMQTYSIGTTAPNLSNFNFIFGGPVSKNGAVQVTANASTTLFTSASSQLHLSPVRDYKLAAEIDIPIPGVASIAKSTLSLSGLFQGLLQEPLGQQITVNGVAITNTGNIVLGQAKWSFPVGTSGVTFPISITASNRTDLIKETNVKGTFGISYNLDSLFSKQ